MSNKRPQPLLSSSRPGRRRRLAGFGLAGALLLASPSAVVGGGLVEPLPTSRPRPPASERPATRPAVQPPAALEPAPHGVEPPATALPGTPGAEGPPGSAPSPAEMAVAVEGDMLSVDLHDAELEQVLQDIATRAGFKLTTSGRLGRVTASFEGVPVEQGLRRLTRDSEVVLVYGTPERGSPGSLAEVRVFGAASREGPGAADAVSEIDEMARAGDSEENAAKLTELLGSAPRSEVRARAAWALGRIGGSDAENALTGALSDQAADVRVQALYALQRVSGVEAVPAIQGLLLRDVDVAVRRAAARTLGMMQEPPATEALKAAAQDPDPTVRREVTRALQRQGVTSP